MFLDECLYVDNVGRIDMSVIVNSPFCNGLTLACFQDEGNSHADRHCCAI